MAEKMDYKKAFKELYQPPARPVIVEVPRMAFIGVSGKGNPNTAQAYQDAIEVLYGLSFGIKMSKMGGRAPEGYFEYVMPPLEGFWWTEGVVFDGVNVRDKNLFCWQSVIRQPEFVTEAVFEAAKAGLAKKKPELDLSAARLFTLEEGLCVQIMHAGPFDDEPASVAKMEAFIAENGYVNDFSDERRHHEIYLGDPRKTAPEKRKTVIRHPVRRA